MSRIREKRNDIYFLVRWLGEDSVSVVFSGKVTFEGEATVGKECVIKLGKNSYTGEILATGTKEEMKRAEEEETLDEDEMPTQKAATPPPSKERNKKKNKASKKRKAKADKDSQIKKARKQNILVVSDHGGIKEKQAPVTSSPLPVITTTLSSSPTVTTTTSSSLPITLTATSTIPATVNVKYSAHNTSTASSDSVHTDSSSSPMTISSSSMDISSLGTGYEFDVRIQELEVKVDGVYNTQQFIIDRLKRLESSTIFGMSPSQSLFQQHYLPPTYPTSNIYQHLTYIITLQLTPTNSNI